VPGWICRVVVESVRSTATPDESGGVVEGVNGNVAVNGSITVNEFGHAHRGCPLFGIMVVGVVWGQSLKASGAPLLRTMGQ
jgi:hypothetical protein